MALLLRADFALAERYSQCHVFILALDEGCRLIKVHLPEKSTTLLTPVHILFLIYFLSSHLLSLTCLI